MKVAPENYQWLRAAVTELPVCDDVTLYRGITKYLENYDFEKVWLDLFWQEKKSEFGKKWFHTKYFSEKFIWHVFYRYQNSFLMKPIIYLKNCCFLFFSLAIENPQIILRGIIKTRLNICGIVSLQRQLMNRTRLINYFHKNPEAVI